MKRILGGAFLLVSLLVAGLLVTDLSGHDAALQPDPAAATPTTAVPQARTVLRAPNTSAPPRKHPKSLKAAVTAIHRLDPGAETGIAVLDRESGTRSGFQEHRQFRSASLVKLLIAITALRSGGSTSDETVQRMLSYSDDGIADRLWVDYGGPDIVTRIAAELGLHETAPPEVRGRWGDTLISAGDVIRIYEYLLTRCPHPMREVILAALRAAQPNGSDGFYQYFGIPSAVGPAPWAAKQGWMHYDSRIDLHTSGLIGAGDRFVVAVLTSQSDAVSWDTVRAAVTAGVRALPGIPGSP